MGGGRRWKAGRTVVVLDTGAEVADVFPGPADHLARHDPARVTAEVEAERAVVDAYDRSSAHDGEAAACRDGLRTTVLLLAPAYADHVDYREAWRP
ncbi:DUF6221 family protein [Streptomyces sp. NPDC058622]|uniref:DUF6221 family protein n=1 Tax=Streptomyces sp. NPDC058622 TaxID=3346562 RepID=UPI003654F07C